MKNEKTAANTKATSAPAKAANYTLEQVIIMVDRYEEATTDKARASVVDALVTELGKPKRSIVAKLSREGVYIKAKPTTKNGGESIRKADIVAKIATAIGENEETLDSLEKATKIALEKLLAFAEKCTSEPQES